MSVAGPPGARREGPATAARRRHRHLDARVLAKLANLQLRVRAVVDGTMAGLHRSPHHGSSIEFAEHKDYSPGDDLRRLDWKAYAKFDRYYIRQYEDETELKAYLLLDASGSMDYGAPLSKLEYGSVLVASLSYLLARQRDQPALVTFGDGIRDYVPPRSRGGHAAAVLGTLERLRAKGPTRLEATLNKLIEQMRRRALVVLVSDLFDVDEAGLKLLRHLRARRHQVVVLHLLHDDELTLPFHDVTLFEGMESTREVLVDPRSIRQAYLREMNAFIRRSEALCKEGEIVYRRVRTGDAADQVLLSLLSGRAAGRAGRKR